MDNLVISLQVILPLLAMLAFGFLLRKIKYLSDAVIRPMNKVVSCALLPLLVFKNIYSTEAQMDIKISAAMFVVIGIFVEFLVGLGFVQKLTNYRDRRGVMLQAMFRSNYVIFGIPIAVSLYGDTGSSAAAVLTTFVIPCFNMLAVISLEIFQEKQISFLRICKNIVTNPLIVASVTGLLFYYVKIPLPQFVEKSIGDLASTATPLAFVLLGASFVLGDVRPHWKELAFTVSVRLVLFPVLAIIIAVLLGFRGVWLVIILTVFASPTAVASYSLVQTLGGDDKLAGNIVVFSSAFSVITMFLWVFALKNLLLI